MLLEVWKKEVSTVISYGGKEKNKTGVEEEEKKLLFL